MANSIKRSSQLPWLAAAGAVFLTIYPGARAEDSPGQPALERGQYLAETVALCQHCHGERNYQIFGRPPVNNDYSGEPCPVREESLAGKDQADARISNLCSPNISSDAETGIGGWSAEDIITAFRDGTRPDGAALHPAMWYPLHDMSDEDAQAIANYILTLPPLVNQQPGRGQVLSNRLRDVVLESLPPSPERSPDRSDEVAYGKYLTDIGRCRYCHTPNSGPGVEIFEKAFTGGAKYWLGGRYSPDAVVVITTNLTPHPEGLGRISRADFLAKFRERGGGMPGSMQNNTVMPWVAFAGMSDDDLGAIWAFLQSLEPRPTSEPTDYDF